MTATIHSLARERIARRPVVTSSDPRDVVRALVDRTEALAAEAEGQLLVDSRALEAIAADVRAVVDWLVTPGRRAAP